MDFLKYLDKVELEKNNELVRAQYLVDQANLQRSLVQDICTQFHALRDVELDKREARRHKGWVLWVELRDELERRQEDKLREQILDTNNEWELYRATLTQVLDLMDELERQEAEK